MVHRRTRKQRRVSRTAVARGDEPPDPITATVVAGLAGAAITAGGSIAAAKIGSKGRGGGSVAAPVSPIEDPNADADKRFRGALPGVVTSPLGDTTDPNLSRNRLLGN